MSVGDQPGGGRALRQPEFVGATDVAAKTAILDQGNDLEAESHLRPSRTATPCEPRFLRPKSGGGMASRSDYPHMEITRTQPCARMTPALPATTSGDRKPEGGELNLPIRKGQYRSGQC